MKKSKPESNRGYTTVELMIVLAMAGLIMVLALQAVGALKRNIRDHARKDIANRVKVELADYAGNNQGIYPFGSVAHRTPKGSCPGVKVGCIDDFVPRYITGYVDVKDPSTGSGIFTGAQPAHGQPVEWPDSPSRTIASTVQPGDFWIFYGALCDVWGSLKEGTLDPLTHDTQYAIVVGLERPGTEWCIDNG